MKTFNYLNEGRYKPYKYQDGPKINFRAGNKKLFGSGDKWYNKINTSYSMNSSLGRKDHWLVKKDELLQDFAKNLDENVVITEKNLNNADPALFGVEPLEFHVKFESEAFVEKAGNRYLFKIGELIGEQIQMYQENERKLPLEDEFTRTYYRDLEVVIPDGYTIANPEDINIDHSFVLDGEELLMFKSTYTLEGNVLKIKADEFYKVNKIDKDFFESYRSVVNSAADFNKVTLVLEPK